MLEVPTVFVLGAGSSVPYGFPTGIELSKTIVQGLRNGPLLAGLRDIGDIETQTLLHFREEFYESGKNSVDAFLEHREDLMEIGKLVTAFALIEKEVLEELFTFTESWLRELYNRLNSTFDEFGSNKVSFVTFNYDRSVENFFFRALSKSYNAAANDVTALMSKIPIVHLHGRLGFLPWQSEGESRPYNHQVTADALRIAAKNIKIIHEDITDGRDGDFAAAKKLLAEADQIILMGFGYNSTNVERLGIRDLPDHKMIGTCVGLGAKGEAAVKEITGGKVQLIGGDCTHFVRELMRWK
jgi:hypothetical protein